METRMQLTPENHASSLSPSGCQHGIVDLQERIRSCRLCQDLGYVSEARPIVSGRSCDRILLIGQAPGRISHEKSIPFAGPGGRVLSSWMEQAGFPLAYFREKIYLTSLTRCFPGPSHHGSGDRPPSRQEQQLCRPFVLAELELLRPKIVLLVGKMAIEAFWGKVRLDDVIGTYREERGALHLPLPHPSGVSRWLNDPDHIVQVNRALRQLGDWRVQFGL